MNAKIKTALFSYLEAGIASAIVLAYAGGASQPIDFLWAFVAGFAGPLVKALNPLDAAFGIKPIVLPKAPNGTLEQTALANEIATAVTAQVGSAVSPALDSVINAVEPVVAPIAAVVEPVVAEVDATPKG
jgi:hypothetical protein